VIGEVDEPQDYTTSERRYGPPPGRPVRGPETGRPIMAALDLLGRRWTLRVLWELRGDGVATFSELQDRCERISSSVLNERLRDLRNAGIVRAKRGGGYEYTITGRDLMRVLAPLDQWADTWAARHEGAAAAGNE
jgi:DNA-binding HxlR family transcriptional regulator